jgi:hypothetical protein
MKPNRSSIQKNEKVMKSLLGMNLLYYFLSFFTKPEKVIINTTASKIPTGISRVASPTDKPITIAAT